VLNRRREVYIQRLRRKAGILVLSVLVNAEVPMAPLKALPLRTKSTHGAGHRFKAVGSPHDLGIRSEHLHVETTSQSHNLFQTSAAGISLASLSLWGESILILSLLVITSRYCQACGRLPCMLHGDEPFRSKAQAPISNLIKFSHERHHRVDAD
jgi:hypothetical protein